MELLHVFKPKPSSVYVWKKLVTSLLLYQLGIRNVHAFNLKRPLNSKFYSYGQLFKTND